MYESWEFSQATNERLQSENSKQFGKDYYSFSIHANSYYKCPAVYHGPGWSTAAVQPVIDWAERGKNGRHVCESIPSARGKNTAGMDAITSHGHSLVLAGKQIQNSFIKSKQERESVFEEQYMLQHGY